MLQLTISKFLEDYNNDSQWFGFSPKHGWIIHDKTLSENTPGSSEVMKNSNNFLQFLQPEYAQKDTTNAIQTSLI